MLDKDLLSSIATQMLSRAEVRIAGKKLRVGITNRHLKTVSFDVNGHSYTAIEQGPGKAGQWAHLVRIGHRVVHFKDAATNGFVAVAVDGKVKVYSRQRSRLTC